MAPVLILQHLDTDGPAYLGDWLRAHGIPAIVRCSAAGEDFPEDLQGCRGLAILGGEMSANDPLPSLRRAEALFLQALERGVPTLGHCLGGQLMARALGARIGPSPAPEIGWLPLAVEDSDAAAHWFGPAAEVPPVFQWHHEAFDLPPGAVALARSVACPQQAFAIGPHLAMQFHVELDADKLAVWTAHEDAAHRALQARHASVQGHAAMLADALSRLAAQKRLADRIYARWLSGG